MTRAHDDEPAVTQAALGRVESSLCREFTSALASLKELWQQQRTSDQRALELQAREYERRLSDLNHSHAKAVEEQARTVPRELFEQYKESQAEALRTALKENQTWKESVIAALAATEAAAKGSAAATRLWVTGVGIVISLLALALRFVNL